MKKLHLRLLVIGLLLLLALPLSQVIGQEADAEEDEEEVEIVLATGSVSANLVQAGRAVVSARGNHFVIDSPTPLGGSNEEVNPLDAFLAGMATCGLFIYETGAQELDIPLNSLTVNVEADFAVEGLRSGTVDPRIRAFRVMIEVDGPTAEQAAELRTRYETRCPLYTTLIRSAPIEIVHVGLDDDAADEADDDAADLPPGPTLLLRQDQELGDVTGTLDVVQMLLAFEPGAWTPPHFHGGHTMVTVVDGEIVNHHIEMGGHRDLHTVGNGWTELPGVVHAAGNDTDELGHVLVSFAMPPGEAITTVADGVVTDDLPAGPALVHRGDLEVNDVSENSTMVHIVLDFPAGVWTPEHYHGGDVLVTVLEGEMTRRMHGEEETFVAGESWIERAGEHHAAGNDTDEHARISGTFILPEGAALTTVVE